MPYGYSSLSPHLHILSCVPSNFLAQQNIFRFLAFEVQLHAEPLTHPEQRDLASIPLQLNEPKRILLPAARKRDLLLDNHDESYAGTYWIRIRLSFPLAFPQWAPAYLSLPRFARIKGLKY